VQPPDSEHAISATQDATSGATESWHFEPRGAGDYAVTATYADRSAATTCHVPEQSPTPSTVP
jgi:hypothetical protein